MFLSRNIKVSTLEQISERRKTGMSFQNNIQGLYLSHQRRVTGSSANQPL